MSAMSSQTAGILFLASLIVALVAVHVPLGDYMYRVYTSNKDSRGERVIYRLIGADPKAEQCEDRHRQHDEYHYGHAISNVYGPPDFGVLIQNHRSSTWRYPP